MMRRIIPLIIFISSLAMAGCEHKPKEEETKLAPIPENLTEEKKDTIEKLKSYANKKREEYRERAERALRSYEEGIDKLKTKAGEATAEARKKYDETMDKVREKQKALREQLEQFKTATMEKWEEMEKKIDAGLEELEQLYEKARSAFS